MNRITSIKGKKNFEEIYKKGDRFQQSQVQLIILKRCDKEEILHKINGGTSNYYPEIKIGIPINRKYGNSVNRNKTKRRIRSLCNEVLQGVKEGYFIIIRPNKGFKHLGYANSKEIITFLFKDAGVLRS